MSDDISDDDNFDEGDAESSFCHPQAVGDVKKNSFVAMKGIKINDFFFVFFEISVLFD